MSQTVKVKLDQRKVILVRNGNQDREEVTIEVKEQQNFEIPDDYEYGELCGEVAVYVGENFPKGENWPISVHEGWFQNNILLNGNGIGKGIMPPRPVIGSFGYYWFRIIGVGVFASLFISGLAYGLIKGKIKLFGGTSQAKTDINNPFGIADKQS